jgi:hypothetical protein
MVLAIVIVLVLNFWAPRFVTYFRSARNNCVALINEMIVASYGEGTMFLSLLHTK